MIHVFYLKYAYALSYECKPSVKDDNYDACKTANMKNVRPGKLAKWALTCYSSSTHERLLSELSRLHILAFRMYVIVIA
jgi:hypothetical protein